MICPQCKELGLKSRVYASPRMRTPFLYCELFYDEEGQSHTHDRNTTTTSYRCSQGHSWIESSTGSCWCGWPDKIPDKKGGGM